MPARWLALLVLLALPAAAPADGCAFKLGRDWPRIEERAQNALIAWRDGRQRMALAVRLDLAQGDGGVWLVPVRGRPEQVRLALAEDLPWSVGGLVDPERRARERIAGTLSTLGLLCCPGAPFCFLIGMLAVPNLLESRASASGMGDLGEVASDGLIANVLPATTAGQLATSLAAIERPVPAERLGHLAVYADGGHSIIAVRIDPTAAGSDGSRWAGRVPALLLDFPSPAPWFPMRASAGGGATQVHLQLDGWWEDVQASARQVPVHRAIWGRSAAPPAAVLAWLGWNAAAPPLRTTRVDLYADSDRGFARDLEFAAVTRPSLDAALALTTVGVPAWFLAAWALLLLSGVFGGAAAGQLLLRRPAWGAAGGATLAIGGSFTLWWFARWWTGTRIARWQEWRDGGPLQWGGWIVASGFALVPVIAVGALPVFGVSPWILPGVLGALGVVYAGGWSVWGLAGQPGGRAAAVRRRAAWVHAAIGLAVLAQALVLAPLLALVTP